MFGGMGIWEILLIFLVVLLLFGAQRLPEIGASLGKGIREFKGSLREIENELKVDDTRSRPNRQVQQPAPGDEVESSPRRLTSSEGRPPSTPSEQGSASASAPGGGEEKD